MMKQLAAILEFSGAALIAAWAQDIPGQKDPAKTDRQTPVLDPLEIRVYVTDKSKKAVDLKDWTASITLLGKDRTTASRTLPMQVVTPKPDDKFPVQTGSQVLEIEGSEYSAEMIVVKSETKDSTPDRKSGGPSAGEKDTAKKSPTEESAPQPSPFKGSYFKTDLPRGELTSPWNEFLATVTFTIKGETRTAKHFQYPFLAPMKKEGVSFAGVEESLKQLEIQVNGDEMDKATATANRLVETMRQDKVQERCPVCWMYAQDIQSAAAAKNKSQALDSVNKLRSHGGLFHRTEPAVPSKEDPAPPRTEEEKPRRP